MSKTSKMYVRALLKKLGVKRIVGLHVQEHGDGCSPNGERLIFVPNTSRNRKRFPDWGLSPRPHNFLVEQFNNSQKSLRGME